jgi:DNA-binding XRE family transcriptional regulator
MYSEIENGKWSFGSAEAEGMSSGQVSGSAEVKGPPGGGAEAAAIVKEIDRILPAGSLRFRTVDGNELRLWRYRLGISQEKFAIMCGWSRQRQGRIEREGRRDRLKKTAEKIEYQIIYINRQLAINNR